MPKRSSNRPWKQAAQAAKQQSAALRQEARDSRTPQEQLAQLDAKLGVGVGAAKERAKLLRQVAKAAAA